MNINAVIFGLLTVIIVSSTMTSAYLDYQAAQRPPIIVEVAKEFTPIDGSSFSEEVTKEELTCINYFEAMGWDEWVLGECQYPDGSYWQEDE